MCTATQKSYRCRNSSVLVLVLIVISAMTVVAFGMAYQTKIEIRLSKSSSQQAILHHIALSGFEASKAILSEKELTSEQTAKVCKFYSTKDNLKLFEQIKMPLDENIQLVFWIKDENSFLDVNKSNSAIWENLPSFSREKRSCILDWIDADSDTNPDGAETDYYERLQPAYNCKNASLICLKEILFVKNITRNNYLGNIIENGTVNPDDIELLFYTDSAQHLSFIDNFTTFGLEAVNINTVSGAILSVLPGLDQQVANIVIAFRSGPDSVENTDDDRFFEKAEDIMQIEGLTELQKDLLTQYCCYNSDSFRVFSLTKKERKVCFLMATIRVAENKPQVMCVEKLF